MLDCKTNPPALLPADFGANTLVNRQGARELAQFFWRAAIEVVLVRRRENLNAQRKSSTEKFKSIHIDAQDYRKVKINPALLSLGHRLPLFRGKLGADFFNRCKI